MFGIPNGGWMPHLCVDHGTGSFMGPDSGHHDDRRGCRGLRKWNLSPVRPGCNPRWSECLILTEPFWMLAFAPGYPGEWVVASAKFSRKFGAVWKSCTHKFILNPLVFDIFKLFLIVYHTWMAFQTHPCRYESWCVRGDDFHLRQVSYDGKGTRHWPAPISSKLSVRCRWVSLHLKLCTFLFLSFGT